MTMLKHYTSIASAIEIAKSGIYHPFSQDRGQTDAGLNCMADGRSYAEGQPEKHEVVLIFEWSGPEKEVSYDYKGDLNTDTLYHQERWRAFVPVGTCHHLILEDVICLDDENVSTPQRLPFYARNRIFPHRWKLNNEPKFRRELKYVIGFGRKIVVGNEGALNYFNSSQYRNERKQRVGSEVLKHRT